MHVGVYYSSFHACGGFISYLFYFAGYACLFQWTPSVSFLLDRCSREPSRSPAWQLPSPPIFTATFVAHYDATD